MPTMAALTVKKSDNTTDIVYAVKSPSAGDGTWASWRQDAGHSGPFSARPVFSHRVSESAKGVRRVDLMYVYPYYYTDANTGQIVISPLSVSFKNGVLTVPQSIPASFVSEAAYQFAHLVAHASLKDALFNQTAFV